MHAKKQSDKTYHKRQKGEVLIENVLKVLKNSGMELTFDTASTYLDIVKDYLKNDATLIINDDPFHLKNAN